MRIMAKPGAHGSDLGELAKYMIENGPRKTLPTSRRVRVLHNHTYIVDTTQAVLVWEHDYYPQYYVAQSALQNCKLSDKKEVKHGGKVAAAVVELTILAHDGLDEDTTDRVVRFADEKSLGPIAGMVRLEFGSMDQWLDEDIPIYVHPKDPYKRVDILPSSRSIEVKVAGKTVAKSAYSMHLLETGLPTRYYLPLTAVDPTTLRKSKTVTKCPYKGEAEYYNVVVDGQEKKDLIWYYRLPTHECAAVAGLVCFYNEKVEIVLDGKTQEVPKTPFG